MEWYAYRYDFNRRKIEKINIFIHSKFNEDVEILLSEEKDKQKFKDKLKRILMYYYWAKAEWEIVIYPLVGDEKSREKIDIYDQVMMNYDKFVDYVWSFRKNGMENKYGQ